MGGLLSVECGSVLLGRQHGAEAAASLNRIAAMCPPAGSSWQDKRGAKKGEKVNIESRRKMRQNRREGRAEEREANKVGGWVGAPGWRLDAWVGGWVGGVGESGGNAHACIASCLLQKHHMQLPSHRPLPPPACLPLTAVPSSLPPPCCCPLLQAIREDIFEVGPEGMTVQDLAEMLALAPTEVVKFLFMKGVMVQMNSTLDPETVKAVGVVSARVGWVCMHGLQVVGCGAAGRGRLALAAPPGQLVWCILGGVRWLLAGWRAGLPTSALLAAAPADCCRVPRVLSCFHASPAVIPAFHPAGLRRGCAGQGRGPGGGWGAQVG